MDADYEEEERKKRERIGGKRRNSVSSESANRSDMQAVFPVHEKKPDQELRIFNIISKSILLKHLDAGPIQIVSKAMFEHKVPPGEAIMTQGEDGDNFYIIDEGICDIFVKGIDAITPDTEEGPQTHEEYGGRVQVCGVADSFGELALMYNAPRAASVVARTEVTLWALDRATFRSMVMGQAMSKRSKHSKFLEGVKLLSTLTQAERETVIDNMEEEVFEEGDEIITQGDTGSKFYIVTEGDVVITQSNACMDYLGEKFGLMGSGAANSAQVRQCMNQAMDLRNAAVGCFYSGSDAAAHVENSKGHYTKFNDWYRQHVFLC